MTPCDQLKDWESLLWKVNAQSPSTLELKCSGAAGAPAAFRPSTNAEPAQATITILSASAPDSAIAADRIKDVRTDASFFMQSPGSSKAGGSVAVPGCLCQTLSDA